jgi:hypothetical protein
MKKRIYLEAKIKGFHDHIKDIEQTLFDNFWELMEIVGHNFEVDNGEYIDIINTLMGRGIVVVGDYYIITDNYNVDNLLLLYEAKRELLENES